MLQFNLENLVFDSLVPVINDKGEVNYTTSGDGWFRISSQNDIDDISASITNNGKVWVSNGMLKWSGASPTQYHIWDGIKWIISQEKQAELEAQQIKQICNQINAKRDKCVNGGVYVPLIKKWVDSDDIGRATLVEIKADFDLNGKDNTYTLICADNTAQVITFDEFKAVWDAVKSLKEAMFENAYMHKILVAGADNPLEYDWSIGWTKTYEEYSKEQENE